MFKNLKSSITKGTMRSGLLVILFSAIIFILTTVAFIVVHVGTQPLVFYSALAYMVIPFLIYALLVEPLMEKLSRKKILLLTFSVMVIAIVSTQSIWVITAPKWSFSVSTNKSTYMFGETVIISVSLKNMGFITHSFKSKVTNPVVISIERPYGDNPTVRKQVWYSPYHPEDTEFSVEPNRSLQRDFLWNQTDIHSPEEDIESGTYYIIAFIPDAQDDIGIRSKLFNTYTIINITST